MATSTYLSNPSLTVNAVDLSDQCTSATLTVNLTLLKALPLVVLLVFTQQVLEIMNWSVNFSCLMPLQRLTQLLPLWWAQQPQWL